MFHPATDTLAFSDHMIGQALLGLPVWFLSLSSPFEGASVGNPILEIADCVLVLLVAFDMGTPLRERRQLPVHADLPQIYRQVRVLPGAVVYDDPGEVDGGALALYYSLFHGKRSAGGYSGFAGPWGSTWSGVTACFRRAKRPRSCGTSASGTS